jgi:hypothetical protein
MGGLLLIPGKLGPFQKIGSRFVLLTLMGGEACDLKMVGPQKRSGPLVKEPLQNLPADGRFSFRS